MHHSGFSSAIEQNLGATAADDRITLPGVLAAEGLATYFVTPPFAGLDTWRESLDPAERQLAADWDRHLADMPSLFAQAATDIEVGLSGESTTAGLMQRWLGGMQGPAYGLGVDMMWMIETELGPEVSDLEHQRASAQPHELRMARSTWISRPGESLVNQHAAHSSRSSSGP